MKRIPILCLVFCSCQAYSVISQRNDALWPRPSNQMPYHVGLGYFQTPSHAPLQQAGLLEVLTFSLRDEGFEVVEPRLFHELLRHNDLSVDQKLTENEISRLHGVHPGNLFIQGRLEIERTEDLLEDLYQVMLLCFVHDAQSGAQVAEIRVFGKDLPKPTARILMELGRRGALELYGFTRK